MNYVYDMNKPMQTLSQRRSNVQSKSNTIFPSCLMSDFGASATFRIWRD